MQKVSIVTNFYPQNTLKWTWIAFSSQTSKMFKLSYYRNYSSDSNQILHSDKDLQVLFVGSPKIRPTNPRWWMAAILKNITCDVSAIIWPILIKFEFWSNLNFETRLATNNLKFWKFNVVDSHHIENRKIVASPKLFDWFWWNFAHDIY